MKVAISYTKSSETHFEKILNLTEQLGKNGIDFTIDYYDLHLGDDAFYFMENLIFNHDYVLVICNQDYKNKADSYSGGVGNEARNLRVISGVPENNKVIGVVFEHDENQKVILPNFLRAGVYVDLTDDNDFTSRDFSELINHLVGVKRIKPAIIPRPDFQNFTTSNCNKLSFYNNIKNKLKRKINLSTRSMGVINRIADYFEENKIEDASIVKSILIKGISGEGKTAIATEFAYKYGSQFHGCFYLDCNFPLDQQFLELSSPPFLDIKVPDEIEKSKQNDYRISLVKDFTNTNPTLLIFDNVYTLSEIDEFLPKSGKSRSILLSNDLSISSPYLIEIPVPKLDKEEALDILLFGFERNDSDSGAAIEIASFFGFLPFALELANSVLRSGWQDVSLSLFLHQLKEDSRKWESLSRQDDLNFVHSSPTIIALQENAINRLEIDDETDEKARDILSEIGCLGIAKKELNLYQIKEDMGFSSEDKDVREFTKIKKRLLSIGIDSLDDHFIVHTLTMEYLKAHCIKKDIIENHINRELEELKKIINYQMRLGTWINCSSSLHGAKELTHHMYGLFPCGTNEEANKMIFFIIQLWECFYFFGLDKECLDIIELGLLIDESNKNFEHRKIRKDELLFYKAVSLHRDGLFDNAMEIYSNLQLYDPVKGIKSILYVGDIFRHRKDQTNSLNQYIGAIESCNKLKTHLPKFEYLFLKSLAMIHLGYFYKEFKNEEKFQETQSELHKVLEELMQDAPENIRNSDNIERFPWEIYQYLLLGDNNYRPLHTYLKIRTIEEQEEQAL
ncbi:toll/interleukin-1 receptor domain-containing protein [Porphyromonas loveana]|uniref:SEFIR domain-containing protein n=1 Tax=Porphyromonas loveana TaxID=1884669 RepID=A0A2U1FST9_9PORP|nr:TIR domain-containing protein [Porphyromonas loveana]PVZ15261.1 SEFIR domain-containing protein [Porphyromonas loveana]